MNIEPQNVEVAPLFIATNSGATSNLSPNTRFHYFIHAVLDSQLIEIDAQQSQQLSLGI